MAGIFGDDPIDKWRERELDEYLDSRHSKDNDHDYEMDKDDDLEVKADESKSISGVDSDKVAVLLHKV